MNRFLLLLFGFGLLAGSAVGQSLPWSEIQQLQRSSGVVSNTVHVMAPAGDSLWLGPFLTVYVDEEEAFFTPDDSVVRTLFEDDRNVVFSLATETRSFSESVVWAGLAFDTGGNAVGAGGFLVSEDGGESFVDRPVHLDDEADTTISYGQSTLRAEPITLESNSAPQDLALGPDADTAYVAGARSGLRRSVDDGQTWSRVVLPPDTTTRIEPLSSNDFFVAPPLRDGRGYNNHVVFSVLRDEAGTLWAGTAAGVNWSTSDDVGSGGDRAWTRFGTIGPRGLTGRGVIALAEQSLPGERNPVWMATWALGQSADGRLERFGLTVTPDGGETFRPVLIGERVNDVAARANRVYAATEDGLFVTGDQGDTWRSIENVRLETPDEVLPKGITARSVATAPSALWVGTTQGLLRLDRADEPQLLSEDPAVGPKWQLFRTDVPVNPDQPTSRVPDVDTYAYPNPFVPSKDGAVRIVYNVPQAQTVEVEIYDFSMNRVRTLREQESPGRQEMVWRGTDDSGLRLPTGTYLYRVKVGGNTLQGKIVLSN